MDLQVPNKMDMHVCMAACMSAFYSVMMGIADVSPIIITLILSMEISQRLGIYQIHFH